MEELNPIFTRLSKDDLLSRCLQGLTQNQNESVNGQLWSRFPKTKFCGVRRVRIAVCETIAVFNTGAASKAVMMDSCGVTPGSNMMISLRQQNKSRIRSSAQKISSRYRKQRQSLRSKRKSKGDEKAYEAGFFGLSGKPEFSLAKKKRGLKRPQQEAGSSKHSQQKVIAVTFVEPEIEVVASKKACKGHVAGKD